MSFTANDKKEIIGKYNAQFKLHGIDPRSLFIPGNKQNARFNVIRECGITKNASVLDVGCGFSDLFTFLRGSMGYRGKYTGIDIVPGFVEIGKKRYPNQEFMILDILSDKIERTWDYVVLSGTLNIMIKKGHSQYVKKMIKRMYQLCNKAISVDFISSYGDNRNRYIYRADPAEMFTFAKTLTPRVCLRHDYMPYEFTLHLYRDERITKNKIFSGYPYPKIIKKDNRETWAK